MNTAHYRYSSELESGAGGDYYRALSEPNEQRHFTGASDDVRGG